MTELTLEQRKARLSKWVKVGLGVATVIAVGPIAYFVAWSLLGVAAAGVAAAIAGILGLALVNFAQVLSMKFVNWKFKFTKDEAAKNPIETMQQEALEMEKNLKDKEQVNTDRDTEIRNIEDSYNDLTKDFPEEHERFKSHIQLLRTDLERRKKALADGRVALSQYRLEIKKAEAIWALATKINSLHAKEGTTVEAEFMRKLKTQTAVDSVRQEMNRSLAVLNSQMDTSPTQPAVLVHDAGVIEMPIKPQTSKVSR